MTADAPIVACEDRPESQAYVAAVKERAFARWHVPADHPETVVVGFQLDEHGRILSSQVRSSSSDAAASAAMQALVEGSPYPPMPPEVQCLARAKLTARFETVKPPSGPAPSAATPAEPATATTGPRWLWTVAPALVLLVGALWFIRARRQ